MSEHFYTSIAKHYPHIFPFDPAQIKFLSTILPYNGAKVMDVGCATGELTFALTRFGFPVWAFDFDGEMIEMAQNAKSEETMFPVFEQLDMRLIGQHYPESFFDTIICFGNTLVHLLNDEDIRQFLLAAHKVLSVDGTLTIQILNYQYILENQIQSLPPIDNEHVTFDRKYEFGNNEGLIDFNTQLTIKSTGQVIKNTVKLYPISQEKLQELLEETGFETMKYYGNFASEPLQTDSLQLIVSCKKKV